MKILSSEKFKVNLRDISQALLISILTPAFVLIQNSLDAGVFSFNWKNITMAGIGGGASYLIKKFFSASKIIIKNPSCEAIEEVKKEEKNPDQSGQG